MYRVLISNAWEIATRRSAQSVAVIGILSAGLLPVSGCHRFGHQPLTNVLPTQAVRVHQVNYPHENLSIIALWYTGDAKNWTQLSNYNGHLRSPSALSPGDVIRIPSEIMIRVDPMTSDFVAEQQVKMKRLRDRARSVAGVVVGESTNAPATEATPQNAESETPPDAPLGVETPADAPQDQLIENLLSE
jgi:hypothetical protein